MNMKATFTPEYVANEFNRLIGHPSEKPNAVELSIARVYRLIAEALNDVSWPDWEIENRKYHSPNAIEPYGIECIDGKFYIYAEQRGQRSAIDLLGFFEPFIPVRRPGWEWVDCAA